MPDFENKDVLLGTGNVNPMMRELANSTIGSISNNDTDALSQQRGNSSQDNEIRDFKN